MEAPVKARLLSRITEDTLIPVSLVITIVGGVFWLSALWHKADANAEAIQEIKAERKEFIELVTNVDKRLSFMEGYVKRNERKRNRDDD